MKESAKPKESVKRKKALTLKNAIILLDETQKVLNAFESGIFPKGKLGKGLLINLACVDGAACVALRP